MQTAELSVSALTTQAQFGDFVTLVNGVAFIGAQGNNNGVGEVITFSTTESTPSPTSSPASGPVLSSGAVAGIVVGTLAGTGVIAGVAYMTFFKTAVSAELMQPVLSPMAGSTPAAKTAAWQTEAL